jgi:hypothetical protein
MEKTQVTTGKVRVSYEHLLKPFSNNPGDEPKFSATFLIFKTDLATKSRIDAAIQAAIAAGTASKWGGVRPPQPPIPVHDGDGVRQSGEPYGPECKGCWVITASSRQQQEIVDTSLQPILEATEIYSGMYARVSLNFFAYNSNGKKGIGCGLGPVQKLADGEPLGGHMTAAEAFSSVSGDPAVSIPAIPNYPTYTSPAPATYQTNRVAIDPITGMPL